MHGENVTISYFAVQHMNHASPANPRWAYSDYAHMLFDGLPYNEARGETGDKLRALIAPTHECWQRTAKHEFLDYADAVAMLKALRKLRRDRRFRLVVVGEARRTVVL